MKRRYRVMSDGTVYRVFNGNILGSFCWPDMNAVCASITQMEKIKRLVHAV